MDKTLLLLLVLILVMILAVVILIFFMARRSKMNSNFGDYTLLELVGKGGMATIYRARNRFLKRTVAVKILDQGLMKDKDLVYKFLKEGENLARINTEFPDSPVVKALEYGLERSNRSYFIAMDYLKGSNLLEIIKSKRNLALRSKLYIIKEVASALDASHSLKIFHRDVTPDNIFVNGKKVTLFDFGIAKQEFSDYRTIDGAIAGKPYYMSPEQCSGKAINEKSDIYSLGAVLFYLLEGKPLYEAKNPIEIIKMHQKHPIPKITEPVPGELKGFLRRMLNKTPEERPDAREVADKMQYLIEQEIY